MDLLNTILNSMDPPPSTNEQQKSINRKQKEIEEHLKNKQKEELLRFRKFVQERVGRFVKDERAFIEFQTLDKVHRSIIHEVAEFGGLIAMSFGREDIDRYTVVYKKEMAPSNDEISARRNGDGWDEEIAREYANRRTEVSIEVEHKIQKLENPIFIKKVDLSKNNNEPICNYKSKYVHLFGQSSALEEARKTVTNKSYGFVPSKNKKDIRSIEQTLADIQAKKKLRLQKQYSNLC